jgi:CP family cyanate transporter-like MFS transporter
MTHVHTGRNTISAPITVAVVFVLALNLRPTVTSLGSALEDITSTPSMSAAIAAVLVAIPLWAIGAGGWVTPWLRAQWGTHRTVTCVLAVLIFALITRVLGGPALLLSGTALACLAIGVIGTVLPVLIRASTPARMSTLSASYTLALGSGSTAGALITPVVVTRSSWQIGLGAWAVLAVVTTSLWQRRGEPPDTATVVRARAVSPRSLFRSTTAISLTLYFGLISTVTFLVMGWLPAILRDAGLSATTAGSCLALAMAMGLPMMWLVPRWTLRWRHHTPLVILLAVPLAVGVAGLLLAPTAAPWVWAFSLGLGMGGLALALTSIALRAGHDPDVTTGLSAMVQGVGYLLAGVGALGCGLLHSITGSWWLPLTVILVIIGGQVVTGVLAVRRIVVRPGRRDAAAGPPTGPIPAQRSQPHRPGGRNHYPVLPHTVRRGAPFDRYLHMHHVARPDGQKAERDAGNDPALGDQEEDPHHPVGQR